MNSQAPDTGPVLDLRAYLLGSWSVERSLLDRATGTSGTFTGVVRFSPEKTDTGNDGALRFHEEGTISWTSFDGKPFTGPASRDYLLRPAGSPDILDMYFPDGRPFHRMGFTGHSSQDEHWCDPDTYQVSYAMIGPDAFRYSWDVTGPAKDHLLETVLHRLGPPTPGHRQPGSPA
ncbi:MAG: hypothetical protein JWO49_1557 [Arthrobacter sp.]|nr:hypothetical protein [Arthrobacter sp.]